MTATAEQSGRRVVCAAIRSGAVVLCGPRHHHCFALAHLLTRDGLLELGDPNGWQQGFVDQWNQFMTREEALALALQNGQRVHRCGGDDRRLFSENLY